MREYLDQFVETYEYVLPGPKAREAITKARFQRYMNLTDLKTPRGPKNEKFCAWCNGPKQLRGCNKYCTPACKQSAYLHCMPQSPESKMWRFLMVQGAVCPGCGECFEDQVKEKIDRKIASSKKYYGETATTVGPPGHFDKVSFWQIGYGTGDRWHTDHIVALQHGGEGIGMENLQILCVPCHHKKTARENSRL